MHMVICEDSEEHHGGYLRAIAFYVNVAAEEIHRQDTSRADQCEQIPGFPPFSRATWRQTQSCCEGGKRTGVSLIRDVDQGSFRGCTRNSSMIQNIFSRSDK